MSPMNTWTDWRELDGKKNNLRRQSHMSNRWKHTINSTSKDVEGDWMTVIKYFSSLLLSNQGFFPSHLQIEKYGNIYIQSSKQLKSILVYMNLGKKSSKHWIFALI